MADASQLKLLKETQQHSQGAWEEGNHTSGLDQSWLKKKRKETHWIGVQPINTLGRHRLESAKTLGTLLTRVRKSHMCVSISTSPRDKLKNFSILSTVKMQGSCSSICKVSCDMQHAY